MGQQGRGTGRPATTTATKQWVETQPFLRPTTTESPLLPKHLSRFEDPADEPVPTGSSADTDGPLARIGAVLQDRPLLTGVGATVVVVLLVMVGVMMLVPGADDGDPNVETANVGDRRTSTQLQRDQSAVASTAPSTQPSITEPATTNTTRRTTTMPSVVVTDPPSTDPPVTEPPTTAAPAPAPEIVRFDAHRGGLCAGQRYLYDVTLSWTAHDATSATIGPQGGTAAPVDLATSRTNVCAERGSVWTLTVTGPGGTTSESTIVPYW